jgi:GntR family transcriptional regulator
MKAPQKLEKQRSQSDALSLIVDAFSDAQRAGLPKVTQLYDAISRLIASGALAEGLKLPGERELCAAVGISLGTAQRSLNLLMNDGELVREHGRGTFVRPSRHAMRALWHYRFRDPETQKLLPVYAKVVERSLVENDALLEGALGKDDMGYVRVSRRVNIDDRFACWSEMFLGATRFKRLLKLPISDLQSVNLKEILDREFNAPTLAVTQTARVQIMTKTIREHLAVPNQTPCLLLQVVATSRRREPITFQRIYVPPVAYDLELTDSPTEVARILAA